MPPKRKLTEVDSAPTTSAVPPSLPPSVEEAYRRKCIQLKNRTNEVEDANDAARLRLARIKRQVEKLRIERAFLLEQLAKRTSTNVEDSEGSPSPPPTEHFTAGINEADANLRKPKDKPLRIKRGHRKPDTDSKDTPSASFNRAGSGSPPPSELGDSSKKGDTNGAKKSASARPADAFELYCSEERSAIEDENKEKDDFNVDEELERRWKELSDEKKDVYKTQFEELTKRREEEEEEEKEDKEEKEEKGEKEKDQDQDQDQDDKDKDDADSEPKKEDEPASSKAAAQDEDVEMGNDDPEPQPEETKDKEDKEAKSSKGSDD